MRYISYNNLGQITSGRLVYFRSTDVEQRNYERLLWSVPDEWLYHMSRGKGIIVNDISSNGKGKIERIFIPVLSDVLRTIYLNIPPSSKNLMHHYLLAIKTIAENKSLATKYRFWKDKIRCVHIIARTKIMKEPNCLHKDKNHLK